MERVNGKEIGQILIKEDGVIKLLEHYDTCLKTMEHSLFLIKISVKNLSYVKFACMKMITIIVVLLNKGLQEVQCLMKFKSENGDIIT